MASDEPADLRPVILDVSAVCVVEIAPEQILAQFKTGLTGTGRLLKWALAGRLRRELAGAAALDATTLPLRAMLIDEAREHAARGRKVHLLSAHGGDLAEALALRLGFADRVILVDPTASRGEIETVLEANFPDGFVYVGPGDADRGLTAPGTGESPPSARALRPRLKDWARALRLHQWAKNSLIFVPTMLGGASHSPAAWASDLLGFLSLGLVASATYVLNDLLDLSDDRGHWTKRLRPFASGRIPVSAGLPLAATGLVAGLTLAELAHGPAALGVVGVYLALTLGYSLALKRVPILDVAILAALFTLRLALGVVCAEVVWSAWLLVFSMFLFSSLSFAKRLTEILRLKAHGGDRLGGRGYEQADGPFVLAMGVSLSAAAVLVLVMYLIEEAFGNGLYRTPQLLWTLPLLLALWLGRIWLLCGRGSLDDDPVIFALRDRTSLALGALVGASVLAAALL